MPRILGLVVVVCVLRTVVFAQPAASSAPRSETAAGGTTSIPVNSTTSEVMGAETAATSSSSAPVSLEQPIDPEKYICGSGDVFELNFWGQQNFRLKIAVDLEGRTFISKVGFVSVAGKTLNAVRTQIRQKVRGNYPGLQFDLTLVSPRSFVVHLVDYVKQPGTYTTTPLERLSALLGRAGGVTGSKRRITIRHTNGSTATADLVKYELTGDTSQNPYLVDGDVISVPSTDVEVSIVGAVRRPGTYELVAAKDLDELLYLAGGFSNSVARTQPLRIVRRNERDQDAYIDVPFANTAGTALRPNDKVLVRDTQELQRSVLLIGAVVGSETLDPATSIRRLPYLEGDTVRSLIDRAGGIKAPGDLHRSYISRPMRDGSTTIIPLDLEALLVRRDLAADKPIAIGDTIVVPPMQHSIMVEGAVARSGLLTYNPNFGVPEYIARAGGRTRTSVDMDEVTIIDSNGKTTQYKRGIKLSPGDSILVPERKWTRGEIVQLTFAGAGLLISAITLTYSVTR
jgi:protein involved in polysaccharide export with SLBB domain